MVTRWNSTFYMLQRFTEEKASVSACLDEKTFQKKLNKAKVPRNIDWRMQEQLMVTVKRSLVFVFRALQSILEPFEAATRKLASETLPTISILLPVITTLITSLEERDADAPSITRIKKSLLCSLEERFSNSFEHRAVSTKDSMLMTEVYTK